MSDVYTTTGDLVAGAFVRGAQAGQGRRLFLEMEADEARQSRKGPRGLKALNQLIDSLQQGHTPSDTLYQLAGLQKPKEKAKAKSFDELYAEHVATKEQTKKEMISGQVKAKAARAAQRASEPAIYRDTGKFRRIPGIVAQRGDVASAVEYLSGTLATRYFEGVLREQLAGERLKRILAVGRRGAAATRPLQRSAAGATNRSGARATRAGAATATERALQSGPGIAGAKAGPVRPVSRQPGVSVGDARARGIMGTSPTMPSATTKQGTSIWEKLLSQQLTSPLSAQLSGQRNLSRSKASPRLASMPSIRSAAASSSSSNSPTSSSSSAASDLTGFNLGQLQLAQQGSSNGKCKCPTPKKEKKKEFKCSNPIVSRYIKDGLIIIKRKLTCQPSKPKQQSPPTALPATSSTAAPSSTPGAANS